MNIKLKSIKTQKTVGAKILAVMLSVILTLSMTFCAGAPVDAVISTDYPFYNGQQIFLDATSISWWINQDGRTYYPYMYLFNDAVSPHIKEWVPMNVVENAERLILTGNVPDDGKRYCGLIFTRQLYPEGNWNYRTHQTIDIVWNGQNNCYALNPASYNSSSNLSGYWTNFASSVGGEVFDPSDDEILGVYTIKTESLGMNVTAEAVGRTKGRADAGDIVTITTDIKDGYSLDTVTVTGESGTQYNTNWLFDNIFDFVMPEENVTVTVKYIFDKNSAFTGNVLWVDTQPSVDNSPLGLVKWTNQVGGSGYTDSIYTLYLPGGVDMSNLPVFFGVSSLDIDGTSISQGQSYSFAENKVYIINNQYRMRVIQSDSASIYLQTPQALMTRNVSSVYNEDTAQNYKETTRQNGGQFMSVGKNGNIIDVPQTLDQIKGRGNSSWEASCRYFGKYAYNIKLNKKADVLNMGAVKAKSFCLLANNADESMLRNIETYQSAAMAGLGFVPHYEVADVYNNGEYLGSYLITEKVDVGKSKLVQGETVEDYHNAASAAGNIVNDRYYFNGNYYDFQYVNTGTIADGVDYQKKSYLLEFDLQKRAIKEHCWFVTPQGQYIAVKSPEDLNRDEMQFIINKWIETEYVVYNDNFNAMNILMDLSSFADVYLIQEFTKNLDSGATSYYVYYDGTQENPKWQATPIWDYDWALGGWGGSSKKIYSGDSEADAYPSRSSGWFAKYKCLVVSDNNQLDKWNFQAKLCNNSRYWNEYVVTAWNSHMYSALHDVFTSKIDSDYSAHSKSFAMNETRYGFIQSDLIQSWGSVNTGDNPYQAYSYLKGWANDRLEWMHDRLRVSFSGISLSADKTMTSVGDTVTLTAVPYPSYTEGLEYTFTVNGNVIGQTTENSVTFSPTAEGTTLYCQVSADGYTSDITEVTVLSKTDGVQPTCTHTGNIEYYTDGTKFYILKKGSYKEITPEETVLPMTDHGYGEPEWHWSDDYSTATAVFTCTICHEPKTLNATVTSETTEPTYEADGETVYTASVVMYGHTYTDIKSVIIPKMEPEPTDWEYSVNDDNTVTVTKYIGSDTNVTIPDTIKGKSVTSVGNYVFYYCGTLTGVTIPDSVISIGDAVFNNCRSLTSLTIGNNVKTIGERTFSQCSKLNHVVIPDSVISIGNGAFNYCSSLSDLTIGKKVGEIGISAFESCSNLSKVTLPDSVISIGDSAFSGCTNLTSIVIPNSYAIIGSSVFSGCTNLKIYGRSSSTAANYAAQNNIPFVELFDFEYSVNNDGKTVTITKYLGCSSNVIIPDIIDDMSVTALGFQLFYNKTLNNVVIPDSVTSIGGYAFAYTTLKDITIPDSVTDIGGWAFCGSNGLTSLTLPRNLTKISNHMLDGCNGLTSVVIPDNVTSIGSVAFYNCSNLTSINIPRSVTSIDETAFVGTGLMNINADENNAVYSSENGVLFNKDKTALVMYPPKKSGSYTIPDGVISVENMAFFGCTGLTDVSIPNSVISIGYSAFSCCPNPTICGRKGSYAESYAAEKGITFHTQITIDCVDINGITTSKTVYAETFTADEFIVPANPYLDGYTFRHWTVNDTVYENSDDVKNAVFTLVSNKTAETIEVKTVYEKNAATYTVNVEVGGAFSDNSTVKEFHVSDIVTVIADKQAPDQAFTCWKRGEKIVSYDKTYSFFMPDEDITLTAIYEGGTEERGIAFIEDVNINRENGKLSFISICGVPEKCKMQNAGLIADTEISNLAAFETARFQRLSDKVTENTKNLKYTWTVGGVKDSTILYVRSYVSYKDSNDNMCFELGDIVEATLTGWQIVEVSIE